ncbi:MAG: hypothetical protein MI924_16790 [Chloroflexales bacterium]|nr:hypothetical protein [Chloroflexales bacterium]
MIMRFPATPSGTQEQIRFNENNDRIPTSRLAGRGPAFTVDAHEQNSTVLQLSPAQWQVVDQVRTAWCARPPDVPKPQPDEMFYDIGINCGGLWPRRLQIPAHAPPAELLTLIDLVPPPAPTPPAPVEGDEP